MVRVKHLVLSLHNPRPKYYYLVNAYDCTTANVKKPKSSLYNYKVTSQFFVLLCN